MHSIEYNLALLKEMMAEFESFAISQELFWPLQKKSFRSLPFPQLSIGALLLTSDELMAQQSEMDAIQDRECQRLMLEFETFVRRWRSAIERKAAGELKSRTNLWQAYLQDLEEYPDEVEEYARQVRNRVLMSKLKARTADFQLDDEFDVLQELDQRLMLTAMSVEFLWDERLKPVYPIEEYPFLYIQPR